MAAKVFISCGQKTAKEREGAKAVFDWFEREHFRPFYAIEVNTMIALNREVIEEIKSSDYFVFINFTREKMNRRGKVIKRGSVYANQELAIAIALGFEKRMLTFQQKGTEKEGIFGFTICNDEFTTTDDLLKAVETKVRAARWKNTSYRQLCGENARIKPEPTYYTDRTTRLLWIAHIDIRNSREDLAAENCTVRLVSVFSPFVGERPSADKAPIKVTGLDHTYNDTISPNSCGTFDLFGVDAQSYPKTYLLSKSDIPREPIVSTREEHILTYEISALGFPKSTMKVALDLSANMRPINTSVPFPSSGMPLSLSLPFSSSGATPIITITQYPSANPLENPGSGPTIKLLET
jgi:hypothetical protein